MPLCKTKTVDERINRGQWTHKMDYILSVMGWSVGLGNLWRFPYVCMKNGGGAFLIPYIVCLVTFSLPIFFLEASVGQFLGKGCTNVFNVCPLLKGVGYSMTAVIFLYGVIYTIINAWILYYIGHSFVSPLPWTTCDNEWNSPNCISHQGYKCLPKYQNVTTNEIGGVINYKQYNASSVNTTVVCTTNLSWITAPEEFWRENVLQMSSGIGEFGTLNWKMMLCLFLIWLIVGLCVIKGVKSIGKIVYVTAILPYILLFIFLVHGLTLDGSVDGIIFFFKPDFSKAFTFKVWVSAAIQVFYSLGISNGALYAFSSFNKFHNNTLRDTCILTFVCEGSSILAGAVIFSVLGYLAKKYSIPIEDVVKSGPGLGFVAYPEALAHLPGQNIWTILFFIMLLSLALDSRFGSFECVVIAAIDIWPSLLRKRTIVIIVLCGFFALSGIMFCFQAGIYLFQIMDWYCSFSLPFIGMIECIVFGWIYGTNKLSKDFEMMNGQGIPIYFRICICFIAPLLLLTIFISGMVSYKAPTHGDYQYPNAAIAFGFIVALLPLIPIPVFAIRSIKNAPGHTFKEKFIFSLRPNSSWMPAEMSLQESYTNKEYHEGTIMERMKLNVFGD
ncbi:sodium- and chloride-dependent glycine transporter 1-like [Mytilus californianus]|uniref:sodium- and chloride-dependent glycine transporter 1-like n=1 Tax=Mytilus californianus TaxID=6549 RepID=UPI00224655D2|nr:sodium- and chloride-dependent glycine transporter 1-like [Mytilus californianus]